MQEISRFSAPAVEIICTNSPTTSHRIPFAHGSGGVLTVAATNGATLIQWYAAPDTTTAPVPVFSTSGATVSTAVTVGAHPFPDSTHGCHTIVPVITGAGTMIATVTVKG